MMKLGSYATVLALFFLSSCSSAPKPIEVKTVPIERPAPVIQEPDPVALRDIKWYIVTEENFPQLMEEFKSKNINPVLFALTDDGYEALSLNFADIKRYIDDKNGVLLGYKEYYQGAEDGSEGN